MTGAAVDAHIAPSLALARAGGVNILAGPIHMAANVPALHASGSFEPGSSSRHHVPLAQVLESRVSA